MPSSAARRTRLILVVLLTISGSAAATSLRARDLARGDRPISAVRDRGLRPLRKADEASVGSSQAVPFRLLLDGVPVVSRVHAFTVLPRASVRLEVPGSGTATGELASTLRYQDGIATASGVGEWRWSAPPVPGIYALRVRAGADSVDLTALVLRPASALHGGALNGYRMGHYQSRPLRGNPVYAPPTGFVEVARGDRDVLVSPHFTLGQFLCKEPGEPSYMALSPALLDKLEAIAGVVAAKGWPASSIVVMSGFRTPEYNAAIGNRTVYSRHLWGDAADIYLDRDGNGVMDDLNGDGRSDVADARVLAGWIDRAARTLPLIPGGLAAYRRTSAHGPFVHVDARGFRARW